MGGNNGRVLKINNLEDQLNQCELLANKNSPIYGEVQYVRFNQMNFNIAQSNTCEVPHPMSIHYLVQPSTLIFPDFILLEDISPADVTELLEIIHAICEMAVQGEPIGFGYQRIAFNKRWGVAGEQPSTWPYQQVFYDGNTQGVYFSPQQMIALSQNKRNPRYDIGKTDVFTFGVMLVEIIFCENLAGMYDYENFEIRLNPLLEKLQNIREEWGDEVANMFICMLQIEEEDRVDFHELLAMVKQILYPSRNVSINMLKSGSSQRNNLEFSRGNRTPGRQAPANPYPVQTPKNDKGKYRNDVSPFRGRFGGAVKSERNRKTPERAQVNRSPMRRNIQANTRSDRQTFGNRMQVPREMDMGRGVSPSGRAYY